MTSDRVPVDNLADPASATFSPEELEDAYNELANLVAGMEMEAIRARNELLQSETNRRIILQEHIVKLESHIKELERCFDFLKTGHEDNLAVLERELGLMRNSVSWRITRPLRALHPVFSRIFNPSRLPGRGA